MCRFQLHRILQTVGLVLATAGFFIAVVNFDSLPSGDAHKRLGIVTMVLGWVQPLNALVRPHPPEAGERPSVLRCAWQFLHRGLGWAAVSLAVSTIIRGIQHAESFTGLTQNFAAYRDGYIVAGVTLLVLFIGLLVMHIVRIRRQCKKPDSDGQYVKSTDHQGADGVDSIRPDSP